jgi:uncharacterized protein YndB with AHSA1/START domain
MTDLGIFLDFHSVRFERLLPGPIERVWDYLTKPEYMKTWLAVAKVDLRVGGTVELTFATTKGGRLRGSRRGEPLRATARSGLFVGG